MSGEGGSVYRREAADASSQPENFGTKRVNHPKGVCRPEASDAPSQPEGLDVQGHYGEEGSGEGTEKLIALVGSKVAAAEFAEVETDTWAEVWQEGFRTDLVDALLVPTLDGFKETCRSLPCASGVGCDSLHPLGA